ncbi:MAG: hypothetical protein ACUVWV_05940 [Thermodesulfobacteriota bacterium]
MEAIQIKIVDPLSQELLKSAFQRGLNLSWDRLEKLQPQDGFLRLGLSCPFGCMHGPCRIDPFGRGADKGLCGLDRDQMVAALLLRLTLWGSWEAMGKFNQWGEESGSKFFPRIIGRAGQKLGGERISRNDLNRAINYLERSAESAETIVNQIIRLALLTISILWKREIAEKIQKPLPLIVGYGLLSQREINIGVSGQPSFKLLKTTAEEAKKILGEKGQLISLGGIVPFNGKYLPCVGTSGEIELILSSGKIDLLIAGPRIDPAIRQLCHSLSIPIITAAEIKHLKEVLRKIKKGENNKQVNFDPPSDLVEEAEVYRGAWALKDLGRKISPSKIFFLGGDDHPGQPLGWIPTEVAPHLIAGQGRVFLWGDAGLWMVKKGMLNAQKKLPFHLLDKQSTILSVLSVWGEGKKISSLGGIFFTSFKNCFDLTFSLGLAALGLKVGVALPLPLWGSELVRALLQKKIAELGGNFTHYDHLAQPEEIIDWFKK